MKSAGWVLILAPVALMLYTYAGYPLLLSIIGRRRVVLRKPSDVEEWPGITICLPAYNEEAQIRGALESLLAIDYPDDKRSILVMSDASTDGTDDIVREYANRGVELLRMPVRGGKTKAENAAAKVVRTEIVVNTDASIRIRQDALKPLIAQFLDPTIGVSSGRDLSISSEGKDTGEASYVGYEMQVRGLETRAGGIIGASGCFYAIRTPLHQVFLPDHLSRDFASALIAREHGFRSVSVDDAVCFVPRTGSLKREYRRKVRTMSRGMETLWHKRHLMNPFTHGGFALKLISHKVCRWALPWGLWPILAGLGLLVAAGYATAGIPLIAIACGAAAAAIGWRMADGPLPKWLSLPTGIAVFGLATMHSCVRALHGDHDATWEPTRRIPVKTE